MLSSHRQWRHELSVCTMAVLRHRRGLWGSEPTSRRGPSKAGELGACPVRHQAFQKPLLRQRLLKGLVHQRTGTQLPRDRKRKRVNTRAGPSQHSSPAVSDALPSNSLKKSSAELKKILANGQMNEQDIRYRDTLGHGNGGTVYNRPGPAQGAGKPRMAAAQPMPEAQASLRCRLPSCPGPAQGAGKPWVVAAQPPRAAQGSGNQGQLRFELLAVAATEEAQGAGLRVAGVADWARRTLSSRRLWRPRAQRLYHGCRRLSEGLGRLRTASRTGPPRSKAKAGDLAACLLRRKAFRKPPQRRRLSEGLGRRRTASRTGPPRSKAKAGDLAACLLRRKAFRKPPQRRRLSEGLGPGGQPAGQVPPRSKAKAGTWPPVCSGARPFESLRSAGGFRKAWGAGDSQPDRSPAIKGQSGDLAACLLRRKAFRKPPQRRRLSEGLGPGGQPAGQVPRDQRPKRGTWPPVCSAQGLFESLRSAGGFRKAWGTGGQPAGAPVYILEGSIVGPQNQMVTTFTGNISHAWLMVVEERCVYCVNSIRGAGPKPIRKLGSPLAYLESPELSRNLVSPCSKAILFWDLNLCNASKVDPI
ncbi:hypothetical protein QTO34_019845 [Cnephaeus nilssonii]|uniref:PRELI/MSF1 domain-containing protein n=1 Tax=Cnephaeus nilssonii TaxID=3371016 RepID=A0AA40HY60_CNENI|nr:hypothetical protein QTO34_019845 [Eptesicus nilssonii]